MVAWVYFLSIPFIVIQFSFILFWSTTLGRAHSNFHLHFQIKISGKSHFNTQKLDFTFQNLFINFRILETAFQKVKTRSEMEN